MIACRLHPGVGSTGQIPSDAADDPDRSGKLRIVLDNLVNNAIKFTGAAAISVGARHLAERDVVELWVGTRAPGSPSATWRRSSSPFIRRPRPRIIRRAASGSAWRSSIATCGCSAEGSPWSRRPRVAPVSRSPSRVADGRRRAVVRAIAPQRRGGCVRSRIRGPVSYSRFVSRTRTALADGDIRASPVGTEDDLAWLARQRHRAGERVRRGVHDGQRPLLLARDVDARPVRRDGEPGWARRRPAPSRACRRWRRR